MTPEESIAWHPDHPGGSTDILPAMRDIFLPRIPHGGTYLEVGSFFGRSLSFVGLERPDLKLVAAAGDDPELLRAAARYLERYAGPPGPDDLVVTVKGPKTHCRAGHPYTNENVMREGPNGARRCRICRATQKSGPR